MLLFWAKSGTKYPNRSTRQMPYRYKYLFGAIVVPVPFRVTVSLPLSLPWFFSVSMLLCITMCHDHYQGHYRNYLLLRICFVSSRFFAFRFVPFVLFIYFFRFVLFRFVSFCFVSFRFVSFRFVSFRFVSFRFVSFRFVLFCFVSSCFVSFRLVSVRFVSFRLVLCRFIFLRFVPFRLFGGGGGGGLNVLRILSTRQPAKIPILWT